MPTSLVFWYFIVYITMAKPPETLPLPATIIVRGAPTDWVTQDQCKTAKMKFEVGEPMPNVIAPYGYSMTICQKHGPTK